MNVAKHSSAACCELRLYYTRNRVVLEVRDKGRGFEPENLQGKPVWDSRACESAFVHSVARSWLNHPVRKEREFGPRRLLLMS